MSVISTPSVAMLLVHPVSGGQFAGAVRGLVFRFPFSPFRLSHATRRAKGGGNGREDGDYDVEDLAPESVVVEGSHFVLDKKITEYRVQIVNRLG